MNRDRLNEPSHYYRAHVKEARSSYSLNDTKLI